MPKQNKLKWPAKNFAMLRDIAENHLLNVLALAVKNKPASCLGAGGIVLRKKAMAGLVAQYALAAGGSDVPETNEWTGVSDILDDLRIHCRENGINFDDCLRLVTEKEEAEAEHAGKRANVLAWSNDEGGYRLYKTEGYAWKWTKRGMIKDYGCFMSLPQAQKLAKKLGVELISV